ncbi:DMT family transporter [Falsirhodobacter deserti]|uniref:DMT family transporter n=1 Tax=Falsirhodobacter deserti TaxID=1365611 RepID=UPI0019D4E6ED|nr:DMT family transporter [Falsirhodobacter deserti]
MGKTLPSNAVLTVLMMAVVALLNAVDAVIVRLLAGEVHAFIIAFFRALFGFLFMLPWILRRVTMGASPYFWMHFLRAALKLASLIALFIAYQRASLPDATAIVFSLPLFVMIGAWVFLGEAIGGAHVVALLAGLVGMLVIIQPGRDGFDPALFYALAGAVLTAVIQLMLKRMAAHDAADRLVAWNLFAMSILSAILAVLVWKAPTMLQLAFLLLQGVLGVANQALITKAMRISHASFVGPLDFMRLPAVALLAWACFGEVAGLSTWIGAVLIFASVVAVTQSARRKG